MFVAARLRKASKRAASRNFRVDLDSGQRENIVKL